MSTDDATQDASQDIDQQDTMEFSAPDATEQDTMRVAAQDTGQARPPQRSVPMPPISPAYPAYPVYPARLTRPLRSPAGSLVKVGLVGLVLLVVLVGGGAWLVANTALGNLVSVHRTTPTGPFRWSNVTRTTAPSARYAIFAQQDNPIDPAFATYYAQENGAVLLGKALTPAYATRIGWMQVFANGALLIPTTGSAATTTAKTPAAKATPTTPADGLDAALVNDGALDGATGVVRLPLLSVLLIAGSTAHLGGDDSTVTYVTLRDATANSHLAHHQVSGSDPMQPIQTGDGVFIPESTRKSDATGHIVPQAIWNYITSSAVAPGGWQRAFGNPLTEALATTATIDGATHHLLVQAFALASVAVDLDAMSQPTAQPTTQPTAQPTGTATAQPTQPTGQPVGGMVLPLGRDYLETLGPPEVTLAANAKAWLTGNTAIVSAPGGSDASVHAGKNFPVTLSGKTQWLDGKLWYEANWQSLKLSGAGWASASVVTMTPPPADDAAAWASFDALSPTLAKYLASYGKNVSSVVYDVTRGRYYSYNENTPFILASSSKVSLLVSYLLWLESQGRGPNASENYTLTNMIEHSDNNAAQLIFDRLGGSNGQLAFYKKIGVLGYISSTYGWGWALLPPLGQMQVLTLLQQGKILTAHDREYALNLMRNIEPDQRMGVGETLPPGATVAMKDGWVPAPNGLWAINTSGIVTTGSETYIIVVYTANQSDYFGAWNITQRVCKEVGQLLTAP